MFWEMLACSWGRLLWDMEDTALCEDQAVQRVQLYQDDEAAPVIQLCQRHLDNIMARSSKHMFE